MESSFFAALDVVQVIAALFVVVLGGLLLTVVGMYVVDVTQTKHAVRHNFPVVGRFRYLFEHLGEFFRQYFFAQDREEMPFDRATRSWVYRAAKGVSPVITWSAEPTWCFSSALIVERGGRFLPPAADTCRRGRPRIANQAKQFRQRADI